MQEIIRMVKDRFSDAITGWFEKNPKRFYLEVEKKDLPQVVSFIFKELKARFVIASGTDLPDAVEILYHFSFDALGTVLSVRTKTEKPDLVIDSITAIVPGAEWIEREMCELLGVDFKGHPKLEPLLLSDDWPTEVKPLRRYT